MALTFFVFLTLVFFLIQAQPGDYASFYVLSPKVTPEARQALERAFGLDRSMWQQYLSYMGNFFQGDLGVSFRHYPQSVTSIIWERFPRTLLLFMTAAVVSFYLGFVIGKIIAWRRGRAVEYVATLGGIYLYTIFTPWLALMLLWLFALRLDWFPVGKFIDPLLWREAPVEANRVFHWLLISGGALGLFIPLAAWTLWRFHLFRTRLTLVGVFLFSLAVAAAVWFASGFGPLVWDILKHMVLPVLTLTLISFAGTMLLTRNSMLETLREDYVFAARARGLPEKVVRDRYVARNALLPVITNLVFSLALAIDGGVITESIFSWPGMGLTLFDAAVTEDLPLAVGAFLFVGIFALVAHLVADVLYVFLDPRIRYQ
jgi:peptide/nickel transport system permease protein